MDAIKTIFEILKDFLDIILIPIIAAMSWIGAKYINITRRISKLETIVMPDGKSIVASKDDINHEVAKVTVSFTHQHDSIQQEFRGKVQGIEEDIAEIKGFLKKDQEHKIDLASTLSGIQSELKHLNDRKRKYDE